MLRRIVNQFVNRASFLRGLKRRLIGRWMWPPPGHFYSPLVDHRQLGRQSQSLFEKGRRSFPGIELNEAAQLSLLKEMAHFYSEQPFPEENNGLTRYYFRNGYYSYAD